ncbi:MAG: LLM class flavin-dependent oxidoreductase [Nitrososphaerota archaeon]
MVKLGVDASFWMDDKYEMRFLKLCERAGFDSIWFGDHFLPWHHSFRHNFFVWSVLATAAERTKKISLGVDVTVPIGGRYHPALVAQAVGTLDNMYPGRFLLGVGTGEAMSEKRFMGRWPPWRERMERLVEGLDLIKKLWTSPDYFDFDGKYFSMSKVYLHLKPKKRVPIYFSAIGEKAAAYAGRYGDRLITANTLEICRDKIFPAFEKAAREAGRDPKRLEKAVLVEGSLVDIDKTIKRIKRIHAGATILENFDEEDPRKIEESGMKLSDDTIRSYYLLYEDVDDFIDHLEKFRRIRADHLVFTDFSPAPEKTIEIFRRKIIPYFRDRG